MDKLFKRNIKVKLAVYMLLMATGVIVVMTFVSMVAYQKYAEQKLLANATENLKAISYTISAGLEFGDKTLIKESLGVLANSREYLTVTVRKADGAGFLRMKFKEAGDAGHNGTRTIRVPVLNEVRKEIGFLEAQITLVYLNQEIERNLKWISVFGVLILGISFYVTLLIVQMFLNPLLGLTEAIEDMSLHSSVGNVPVTSDDEIGKLAMAFNALSDNLQRTMTSRDELKREIKERKRTEEELRETHSQLVQSEKMASIGQLAAGVAHEINNPIGFVASNMQILEEYIQIYTMLTKQTEELKKAVQRGDLAQAKNAATAMDAFVEENNVSYISEDALNLVGESRAGLERVKKIVMDLRTFSRSSQLEMENIDIQEIIQSVLNIVQNEIKYKCSVKEEYQDIPRVQCNAQRLSQVLINLLINAAQAMDKKGTIIVRTYREGNDACIDVEDDGAGIPPERLSQIFDPFFTTKPVGEGTGLGLSISYEIIKKAGGDIKVESEAGRGTKFTVMLPLERNEINEKAGEENA